MATLGGIDLGSVQSESQTKDSQLFQQPIPKQDSTSAFLLDLFGMSRSISIEGIITGEVAVLRTFISNIEALMTGNQTGSTYVSDIVTTPSSRTVFLQTFNWSYLQGAPTKLSYNLTLIEGAAVA